MYPKAAFTLMPAETQRRALIRARAALWSVPTLFSTREFGSGIPSGSQRAGQRERTTQRPEPVAKGRPVRPQPVRFEAVADSLRLHYSARYRELSRKLGWLGAACVAGSPLSLWRAG